MTNKQIDLGKYSSRELSSEVYAEHFLVPEGIAFSDGDVLSEGHLVEYTRALEKHALTGSHEEIVKLYQESGIINLDGSTLNPGDLDKTFADFGIKENCFLLNVAKVDNA